MSLKFIPYLRPLVPKKVELSSRSMVTDSAVIVQKTTLSWAESNARQSHAPIPQLHVKHFLMPLYMKWTTGASIQVSWVQITADAQNIHSKCLVKEISTLIHSIYK